MSSWWEALLAVLCTEKALEWYLCILFGLFPPVFLVGWVLNRFILFINKELQEFCSHLYKIHFLTSSVGKTSRDWGKSFLYSLIKLCRTEYNEIGFTQEILYTLIMEVDREKAVSILRTHLLTSLWHGTWYENGQFWILRPTLWGIRTVKNVKWWIRFIGVVLYWSIVIHLWTMCKWILTLFGVPTTTSFMVFLNILCPSCGNFINLLAIPMSVLTGWLWFKRRIGHLAGSTIMGSLFMAMMYAYNIESFSDDLIPLNAVDVQACNQSFIVRIKDTPEVPTRFSSASGFYTEKKMDWAYVAPQLCNIESIVIGGVLPISPTILSHIFVRGSEQNQSHCDLLIKDLSKKYQSYNSLWIAPIPDSPSKPIHWWTLPSEIYHEFHVIAVNLGIAEKPVVENVTSNSWSFLGLFPAYVPNDDVSSLWKCQSLNNAIINSVPYALQILENQFADWWWYHLFVTTREVRRQVVLYLKQEDIEHSPLENIFVQFISVVGPKGLGIGTVNGLKRLEWYRWVMGQT